MNVGISIRKIRQELTPQLNQSEFANYIGISQTYLSQIETGKKIPAIVILERISKSFEIPLPVIFWFGIEEKDIQDSKKGYFRFLKPTIDSMIDSII
jgi:transcriptional regulator with XRE-family HTH domain